MVQSNKIIHYVTLLNNECVCRSDVGEELPRWKKTLIVATLVAFVRSGKGRENKGMQEWLKKWEVRVYSACSLCIIILFVCLFVYSLVILFE